MKKQINVKILRSKKNCITINAMAKQYANRGYYMLTKITMNNFKLFRNMVSVDMIKTNYMILSQNVADNGFPFFRTQFELRYLPVYVWE